VITARTRQELRSAFALRSGARTAPVDTIPIGAALLDWDLFGTESELRAALDEIHGPAGPPVVLLSERADEQIVSAALAARTAGSFWLRADSPNFVADQVEWLVRTYALRSQVIGALAGRSGADYPRRPQVAGP
jgi:hypothetical protein